MKTDCTFTQNDLGKNLYSKTTYYTVRIEQHVIAKDKDEADELFLEHGGINHSAVNNIAEDGNGVETTVCDANYTDCLLYTSPSPRDASQSRIPSSA